MNIRWQTYFMRIAREVAKNSRCLSRQIGVVVVRDNSILSTGYNGPPRGIPHCNTRHETDENIKILYDHLKHDKSNFEPDINKCPRQNLGFQSGEGLSLCTAVHAEVNAIAHAAKEGVSLKYATMIMTCGVPCRNCLATIINSGIITLYVPHIEFYDRTSDFILSTSQLNLRLYEGD